MLACNRFTWALFLVVPINPHHSRYTKYHRWMWTYKEIFIFNWLFTTQVHCISTPPLPFIMNKQLCIMKQP